MSVKKYFWDFKQETLNKIPDILRNPDHPKYIPVMTTLLSRCDNVKEVFEYVNKETFIHTWPKIRKYWKRTARAADFLAWWETIYEESAKKALKPRPSKTLAEIGSRIRAARNKSGFTQKDLANMTGMTQADISRTERGYNIKLISLIKILKALKLQEFTIKIPKDNR